MSPGVGLPFEAVESLMEKAPSGGDCRFGTLHRARFQPLCSTSNDQKWVFSCGSQVKMVQIGAAGR